MQEEQKLKLLAITAIVFWVPTYFFCYFFAIFIYFYGQNGTITDQIFSVFSGLFYLWGITFIVREIKKTIKMLLNKDSKELFHYFAISYPKNRQDPYHNEAINFKYGFSGLLFLTFVAAIVDLFIFISTRNSPPFLQAEQTLNQIYFILTLVGIGINLLGK